MLKYLPVFARELEVGTELAVRSNVVVVMCDLCVRYTNTVTRYIPNISACLRDKDPIVREQTLIMLTNLLQVHTQTCNQTSFFYLAVSFVLHFDVLLFNRKNMWNGKVHCFSALLLLWWTQTLPLQSKKCDQRKAYHGVVSFAI